MKRRYTLTGQPTSIGHLPSGKIVLTFEEDFELDEGEDLSPDSQSEMQNDMIWEIFDHEFEILQEPNEEVARILEYAEENGFAFRSDYSGRAMFGASCVGIVVDNVEDTIATLGIEGAQFDNMGKQWIVYWPRLKREESNA